MAQGIRLIAVRRGWSDGGVSDITYIWTCEDWLYLAGVKDLYNKEIIGYCMSERMTKDIVIHALNCAILKSKPQKGLILHSDRGSQYCSNEYRTVACTHGMRPSMSRKGNCWDNAPMESFWGLLKNELVHHTTFATRTKARKAILNILNFFTTDNEVKPAWFPFTRSFCRNAKTTFSLCRMTHGIRH